MRYVMSLHYLMPGMLALIAVVACGGDSITTVALSTPTALSAVGASPSPTPTAGPLATPPPVPGEWTRITPMLTGRTNHAAVPLPDGSVLVFGGVGPDGYVTASEIYRPESGEWESAAEMVAPYQLMTPPVVLSDGRVVAVGGTSDQVPSAQVQVFDPAIGEWAAMPDLPVARFASVAAALPDSSLLVTGGTGRADEIFDTAIRFDSLSSTWVETEAAPFETIHPGFLTSQNKSALPWGEVGTLITGSSFRTGSDQVAWFDVTSGTWEELEPAPTKRRLAGNGLLSDGRIIVFGGFDGNDPLRTAEIYDPSTDRWSSAAAPGEGSVGRHLGNLPDERAAFVLLDDNLQGETEAFIGLYTPSTDLWETFDMPDWLLGMATVMLPDGRLLATGGKFGVLDYESTAWVWAPPQPTGNGP